jgi:hypothetical protein
VSSVLLDPRVLDASSLTPRATSPIYLPIGVEGQMDNDGAGTVGVLYVINRDDEAVVQFGVASKLTLMIKEILARGAGPVVAAASAKGSGPTLVQRQAVWASMESDTNIRIRLTASETQADLVALATSLSNADLLFNKQISVVGMPIGTTKANLITAATAIQGATTPAGASSPAATRIGLIGPAVYDQSGTLRGGSIAAAATAAEIAKNADPSNDLDLWPVSLLTGIEKDVNGLPVFRRSVVAGTAVDDYEDLLQAGVSPLQPSRVAGGVMTTHLRTCYIVNTTYDNLYTRIIVDQVFIDVRDYILDQNFLRTGNTAAVRARMKSGIEALLNERQGWISPVLQPDGSQGYNVTVTPSSDQRQVTIGYEGTVVRGISTVKVAANLTIPA